MDRGRRDDASAVAAQIDAGESADPIGHGRPRVREVEMPAAPARRGLDGERQRTVLALQPGQAFEATVPRIDVDDHEPRLPSGDDPDIRIRPAPEPGVDLAGAGDALLELEPRDERSLAAGLDRDHRPAARRIVVRSGANPSGHQAGIAWIIALYFHQ
jgi:hypothetical protein